MQSWRDIECDRGCGWSGVGWGYCSLEGGWLGACGSSGVGVCSCLPPEVLVFCSFSFSFLARGLPLWISSRIRPLLGAMFCSPSSCVLCRLYFESCGLYNPGPLVRLYILFSLLLPSLWPVSLPSPFFVLRSSEWGMGWGGPLLLWFFFHLFY